MKTKIRIIAILFFFQSIVLKSQNIIGISPLNNVGGTYISKTDYLEIFEIIPNASGFTNKKRELGTSLKSLNSAGHNEGITQVNNSFGGIDFYAFINNVDGFNLSNKDELIVVAFDDVTNKDEILFRIETTGFGANSSKDLEAFEDDHNPGKYYLFYKNEALNSNSTLSYIYFDLKTKKIIDQNIIHQGSINEGLAITSLNCNSDRWLLFTENKNNVIAISGIIIGKNGISQLINLGNSTYDQNTTGGQGDLELSHDNKLLAYANFSSTDIEKDVYIFDIDLNLGKVNNERTINNPFGLAFGLAFSPDSKRIYIGQAGSSAQGTALFNIQIPNNQYTLKQSDKVSITCIPGKMEVLSNGFLYVPKTRNNNTFDFIENPNMSPSENKYSSTTNNFYGSNNFVNYEIPDFINGKNDIIIDVDTFTIIKEASCINDLFSASIDYASLALFTWTYQENVISNTNLLNFYPSTSDTLFLKITLPTGCEKILKKFIEIKPFESAEFTIDVDPCDNTITINPKVFEGTYLVRDEFGNEVGKYTDNVFKVKPGDYQIEHLLNAGTPCASLFIQVVSLKPIEDFPAFKIKNAPPSLCEGDSLNISVAINSTFKTEWILDGNIIASGNDLKFTPKTDALFVVKITSPNGCIKYDTAMVKIVKSSDPKFEINYDACKNNVTISPITKGGFVTIFDNQNNEIRKTDSLAFDLPSGKYKFTYELNAGLECSSEESKIIDLPNSAVLNRIISSSKDSICIGADNEIIFSISLSNNENIVWNLANGIILGQEPSIIINPTKSDTIIATVTNSFGCSKIFKKTFYVGNKIDPAFEYKYDICTKNATINGPTGNTTIIVRDEKDSLVLKTNDTSFNLIEGNYTIELITNPSQYCEARLSKKIEIEPIIDLGNPIFSNVFSPNNDNVNDYFCSSNELIISPDNYELKIYDRWGNLVFKSNDQGMCWDGTINGIACELGVYTYILEYKLLQCDQIIKIKTGDVALVK
jgi:gliding motility-associated-like protein